MVKLKCNGWWEQAGYGRQFMDHLELHFESGQLRGSGTDIVGDFLLSGAIDEGGSVQFLKQYIDQHQIHYEGTSDGEGTFFGSWDYAGSIGGKWLIKVIASTGPIQEIGHHEF